MRSLLTITLISLCILTQIACSSSGESGFTARQTEKKIGVLLANHGSRSATWRQALLTLEENVKDSLIGYGKIAGTKTAFMEYNEPSIATRLKEFDAEGYTDVIIVPVFLTVSSHSFDDIPTIIGKKEDPQSLETLKIEKIERYTPRAETHITPLLDFSGMLKENVLRRASQLSKEPAKEGLVMIAYGDATYMKEWSALMQEVGEYIKQKAGISPYSFGWCGHVAHYNPDSVTVAINRVLAYKEKALVVPVLVAHDEMFQVKIIGDGIANTGKRKNDVAYVADSILPDKNIEAWVIRIVRTYADKLTNNNPV
ncbi:MAG: sirohydrochlorin chelatase [Cyclobacteriaceae bacterium]